MIFGLELVVLLLQHALDPVTYTLTVYGLFVTITNVVILGLAIPHDSKYPIIVLTPETNCFAWSTVSPM
jgi:hypothetical protein